MTTPAPDRLSELISLLFKAHPWHGISAGADAPQRVSAYIEIVPADTVKYEVDKPTGHLKVDRPQRYSSLCPTLYGFIPQTYCGELVAARCAERNAKPGIEGDKDPLDICIISEKVIPHGDVLLKARPLGGLRMVDGNEADDKILAVLEGDFVFGGLQELSDVPQGLVERLRHYFLSYKNLPGETNRRVDIVETYGREEALEVIRRSMEDYRVHFGEPRGRLDELRRLLTGA